MFCEGSRGEAAEKGQWLRTSGPGQETTHQGKESDQRRRLVLCYLDPASRVPLIFAQVGWVFWCRVLGWSE